MNAVLRVFRNPAKYFRRSFWLSIQRIILLFIRPWLYFSPLQWRRRMLGERPIRMYVFPAAMDKYQFAELYLAWKVMKYCNIEEVHSPEGADIAIAWEPSTEYVLDNPLVEKLQQHMTVINAACTDIRKSRVDGIFADVFGYSLAVDPRTFNGTILRKSEKNGAHDAKLFQGPIEPETGYVYQRLVTPEPRRKGYPDYRTYIVGGRVVAVNLNFRPVHDRFCPLATGADAAPVEEIFTEAELASIQAFDERVGLEFGVLDIIRDRDDGRIYIMDCNNTATGPSRSLSIPRQLAVVATIGRAFEETYLSGTRVRRSSKADGRPSPAEETLSRQ